MVFRRLTYQEMNGWKSVNYYYYAEKLTREMDKLAEERSWTQETYDSWLNEHMRTPYKK